ncbi:MAG: TIGR02757 family protein [Thermodesulfovibrio sp.]|nr:TIGR02757 family protein [Thermodesulfovibrio sp.]
MKSLRQTLDRFYRDYDFQTRLLHDPIEFPHRYKDSLDIEIVGFISTCLAYGKVELFKAVLEQLFSKMGSSPHDFILSTGVAKQKKLFAGIKYRFNENEDILCLFYILKQILRQHESLYRLFRAHDHSGESTIESGLVGIMETARAVNTSAVYGKNLRPAGLQQFFSSPAQGSACKRANLFLRWMIRDRDIDFGIWKEIPKNRLVIPLDTHIARISRCLAFTARKTQDWSMAVEITEALKRFDPEDPLKYDFALCHHGISGVCKGNRDPEACRSCVFLSVSG